MKRWLMRLNAHRAFGDVGALLAGAILPLAFAPFGLAPLAILSPAILFWLWIELAPGRSFWRGWLYGLGMFGIGVSWVQISIHQFGLPVLAFSVTVTVLFITFLALYPALLGYLVNRLFPGAQGGVRFFMLLPASWTLMEWLRSWLLTGFPWLNLGYSQIDSPLAGIAPVLGVYGVSFAVVLSAGTLCYAWAYPQRLRCLVLLVPLWGAAWLANRIAWTESFGAEPIEVALIQGNIPQTLKWLPARYQATLDRYLALSAPHWGIDLMIWPETAIPAFYHSAQPLIQALQAQVESTGTDLLIGVPSMGESGKTYYNSVVRIGSTAGFYHKRHLVPFGEYMPLQPIVGRLLSFLEIPMADFSAGSDAQSLLRVADQPVGISICYEDAFGEEVIDTLPHATLLVNVSNDAWFGDSIAPHQHLEMARMRALETGRYLLRATNTGISAVIDRRGTIMARSPQFEAHALIAQATPYHGATPYVRFGNAPVVVALIFMLGLGATLEGIKRQVRSPRRRIIAVSRKPRRNYLC
jgi:apolipoprotein N-acyltransferase